MDERILYQNCPLCESENIHFHKTGDCSVHPLYNSQLSPAITWKKCADCTHIFTEGYYSDEAARIVFAKTSAQQITGSDPENHRHLSARMVDRVLPYVSHGQWLDIGIGNGSLLFTAQEYGFTAIGTDLRADNVNVLKALGIEAYNEEITTLKLAQKCSVISMADVLEHIPYPKTALAAAHDLMKEDGILMVSMPNIETVIWDAMDRQKQNPYWGEMEHYHNFSRTRLYALLSEFGFKPRSYGVSQRYRICMEVIAQKV